jgi:hypothetical protein
VQAFLVPYFINLPFPLTVSQKGYQDSMARTTHRVVQPKPEGKQPTHHPIDLIISFILTEEQ